MKKLRNKPDYYQRRKRVKYIVVPPPIKLVDVMSGAELKALNTTDDGGTPVQRDPTKPVSMREWFLGFVSPLFKGYKEFRAGRAIEKALAAAEKEREVGAEPFIAVDDAYVAIVQKYIDTFSDGNGNIGMQFLPFMDAIDEAKSEKPKPNGKEVVKEESPAPSPFSAPPLPTAQT